MSEEQLRAYWYPAYTDALKLMKNHQQISEQHIAQMVKKYGNTVFNRMFCLAVWQEIKRIRTGRPSLPFEQYTPVITEAWKLFKEHCDPNTSEIFWEDLVNKINAIADKYGEKRFVSDLLIHVTLEEIERIWRASGKI